MISQANRSARQSKQSSSAGFSLIELLIVIAIILIIAAIALPNYMRSRMLANEAATIQNMRNICTAGVVYTTAYGIGFSASLANLGGTGAPSPINAGLIDSILATGVKSGYQFTYVGTIPDALGNFQSFTLNADPVTPGTSGRRNFYTDQTGVIRQNLAGVAAGPGDTPI